VREPNKVSKLMTTRHANEEYNEITNMQNKLKNIPNYQNYFLVDKFTVCEPDKLTEEDLVNFENCGALSKKSIITKTIQSKKTNTNTHLTSNQVNVNLSQLKILNMPFGGIPVDDFIKQHSRNIPLMYKLNVQLLDLLKNGIIPLNNHYIYHNDIKDSNVLVNIGENNMKTRLIDWGLSCTYKPNDSLPKTWKNRPLQFNVPFSIILFSDLFNESYKHLNNQTKNKSKLKKQSIIHFVKSFINEWGKKRGNGHLSYIQHIFKILGKNKTDAHKYIVNYIAHIVMKLSETFTITDYLNNVFIKTIDIWGFITLYIPLLDLLYSNFQKLIPPEKKIYAKINYVFMEYLYKPRITKINITSLVYEIESINSFILELKQ
jgi:hypothetical protein